MLLHEENSGENEEPTDDGGQDDGLPQEDKGRDDTYERFHIQKHGDPCGLQPFECSIPEQIGDTGTPDAEKENADHTGR